MEDGPVQFTLRRLQGVVMAPRFWAVIVAVAVVLGIAGPFGTLTTMPLVPRTAYWLGLALITFLVGYCVTGLLMAFVFGDFVNLFVRLGLAGLLAGIPVTTVVLVFNRLVLDDTLGAPLSVFTFYVNCSLIAAAISVLFGLLEPGESDGEGVDDDRGAAPERPAIMTRLPVHLRGRLVSMSTQDHYVDVRTDRGGTLVLMRFADAIAEVGDTPGLRIHRSHWVALDAVAGSGRRNGRAYVRLIDGTELPVSRGYLAEAKAAGLI